MRFERREMCYLLSSMGAVHFVGIRLIFGQKIAYENKMCD